MGAWGTGIFQNDVSEELKTDYLNKLKIGKTDKEAFDEIFAEYEDMISDPDDEIDFWFSISYIMHKYGRLTEYVKNKAISIIDSGADNERWKENKTELKQRSKVIEKLKETLTGIMPERKKVRIYKKIIAPFEPNEVYTLKLTDEYFTNSAMYNKYLIFIVKSLAEHSMEVKDVLNVYPKVYIKFSDIEPRTIADIDKAVFIPHIVVIQEETTYEYALIANSNLQFKRFKNMLSYIGKFEDYIRPNNENESKEFSSILMPIIKPLYWNLKRMFHHHILGEKNLPEFF